METLINGLFDVIIDGIVLLRGYTGCDIPNESAEL
jgi:hypothetical protein